MEALIRSAFDAVVADPELKKRTLEHVLHELHSQSSQGQADENKDSREKSN